MTGILLAYDHEIVRSGLRMFINTFVADVIIDEAADGDTTLEKVKLHDYELIILDVNMPGTDSFELLGNIILSKPGAKVLMFSMEPEAAYAWRYLKAGAKGYISKGTSSEELGEAITAVLENKRYVSTLLKDLLMKEISGETNNPFTGLSAREFGIVQLLIKGESSTGIQNTLNLKPSTVSTHKARIFQKLGCKNMIDLVRMATMYNII